MAKTQIEIETPEQLGQLLEDFSKRIHDLEKRPIGASVSDTELGQLQEKVKSLTLAFKSGAWRPGSTDALALWDRQKAENFGAFVRAVAARNTAKVLELGGQPGSFETKATTGTPLVDDSVTGSYLVPVQYVADILRVAEADSELRPKVRTVEMTSRTLKYPKKVAGVSFTRVTSDAGDLTEQNPTFTELDMAAETWALWISVTEAFMEDSLVTIGNYFRELISEGYTAMFDANFLNHAANPTGILQNAGVNVVRMGAGKTGFEDIEADDLSLMISALTTRAKRKGASYYFHPTVFDIVCRLKNANGDYIFQRPIEGRPGTVWGYPYILSDEMPDSGDSDADTGFVAFGDPRQFLFGNRVALELKYFGETVQAVTNTEVFFRARVRAAWEVGHADSFVVLKTAVS